MNFLHVFLRRFYSRQRIAFPLRLHFQLHSQVSVLTDLDVQGVSDGESEGRPDLGGPQHLLPLDTGTLQLQEVVLEQIPTTSMMRGHRRHVHGQRVDVGGGVGPESSSQLIGSWILTSRQPHRVTSGRITRSSNLYSSSKHESLNHKSKDGSQFGIQHVNSTRSQVKDRRLGNEI